jgi:hypothetical protein
MHMLKTSFEQVPIEEAKHVAARHLHLSANGLVVCVICNGPVALEHCKTDERGQAIHQKCYFGALTQTAKKKTAKTRAK